MHKFAILLIGLTFTAASCDLANPLSVTSGARGVFKSEDGGESFRAANSVAGKGSINSLSANALVFAPDNPDVIYLAGSAGIYKSENAAKTWTYVLTGIAVADVAIDSRNPDIIYAAGVSGNNGKIVKSRDGGNNWTDIYTEPSKSNPVMSLAVSSSFVIAGLSTGEIIRSFDGGNTWQAGKDLENYIIKIRFAPNNSIYVLTRTTGIFKSPDSGSTWTSITNLLTQDSFSNNVTVPAVSIFHDFSIDQRLSGVIYLGAEEGLYRTVNDGGAWNLMSLPLRDTALKASAVAVNPSNSNNVFVSIGFTMLKSTNGGLTWETKELATEQAVRLIAIDPQSPNVVYLGLGARK